MSVNVAVQNRDSQGRFLQPGKMSKEDQKWRERFKEENKLAECYIELCKKIGRPDLVEHLGMKQYPETSNWNVGREVTSFFTAFMLGTLFGQKEDKKKVSDVAGFFREILSIEGNVFRLDRECFAARGK